MPVMSIYLNKKVDKIHVFQHFYHMDSLIKSTYAELTLHNYDRICHRHPLAPLIYEGGGRAQRGPGEYMLFVVIRTPPCPFGASPLINEGGEKNARNLLFRA